MRKNTRILDRQFVPAGQLIIKQGASGRQAFLIESGHAVVLKKNKTGDFIQVGEVGPGEIIGEMAALSGDDRCATIRTTKDTIVVTIPADDLQRAVHQKTNLFYKMMKIIDRRTKTNKEHTSM